MANIKISQLTALTSPDAADLVPVTDSSASQTKRTTVGEIVGIISGDVEVANDGTATISEVPVSKLQDGTARQLLQTDAAGIGVEWTSNVDVPGTLDVTGATTLDSTLTVPLGSGASPTLRFSGDANTGVYSPGADQIALSTSGTGRLFVDASGNVKIANGSLFLGPSGGEGGQLEIRNPADTDTVYRFDAYTASNARLFTSSDNIDLQIGQLEGTGGNVSFHTGANERFRCDSSGRLLVGTSTAYAVEGFNRHHYFNPSASDTNNHVVIGACGTSGYPAVYFTRTRASTANVATTAVQDDDLLGLIDFYGANGTDFSNNAASISAFVDGEPFTSGDTTDLPGRLVFSTTANGASSPTERMRIKSSGEITIGHSDSISPNPAGCSLSPSGFAHIGNNAGNSGWGFINFYRSTTLIGNISQNGTTGVSYNTSSDYRLKENVTAVTDGLTRLQRLKPSRFNFIADPTRTVDGFLAHEVAEVVPECVTGVKDAVDDDGNPIYQGIDQSKLVPLLTAALQEAIGEIESLKARVAALEAS